MVIEKDPHPSTVTYLQPGVFRRCTFLSLVANLMTLTWCISADICPISIILFAFLFLSLTLFVRVIHSVLRQIPREMKNCKPRNLRFSPASTRKVSVNIYIVSNNRVWVHPLWFTLTKLWEKTTKLLVKYPKMAELYVLIAPAEIKLKWKRDKWMKGIILLDNTKKQHLTIPEEKSLRKP